MQKKVTITLDEDVLAFVDHEAVDRGGKANRSQFINAVLASEKGHRAARRLAEAYQRDARDAAYQAETAVWNTVAGDGLGA